MQVIDSQSGSAVVKLTIDEICGICNAFNEVLHGLDLEEFHARMGFSEDETKVLLNEFSKLYDQVRMKRR